MTDQPDRPAFHGLPPFEPFLLVESGAPQPTRNDGETEFERGYIEGARQYRIALLRHAIREILGDGGPEEIEARRANWIVERQELIAALRDVCSRHGDNDWSETDYLADVVTKHLDPYLFKGDENE